MTRIFTFLCLLLFIVSCKEKKAEVNPNLDKELDSLRQLTAMKDSTLQDTVEVDSSTLKKELKKDMNDVMKGMKDTLKEVIIRTEKEKVIATSIKGKKTKTDSFEKITGMDIKYSGILKKDTSSKVVYMVAFFNENFEGKLKLKAYDKKGSSKQDDMIKVGGKYVKNDKKVDAASAYVKQDALSYEVIKFKFDEAYNLDNIDYFEISVLKQ